MIQSSTQDKKLYSIKQAAQLSGMSEAWWRMKIFLKQVPVVRIGRSVKIGQDFLTSLIEKGWQGNNQHREMD